MVTGVVTVGATAVVVVGATVVVAAGSVEVVVASAGSVGAGDPAVTWPDWMRFAAAAALLEPAFT